MASARVVQAGGSAGHPFEAEHPFEAAPHLPPEEEVPLDFRALRARLSDVLTRSDELLSEKDELATEQGMAILSDLSEEIDSFACALGWAIPAREALAVVQRAVVKRGRAVLEVLDIPVAEQYLSPGHSPGSMRGLLRGCNVPERWQRALEPHLSGAWLSSDDIPF